jgi:hypothetical protein
VAATFMSESLYCHQVFLISLKSHRLALHYPTPTTLFTLHLFPHLRFLFTFFHCVYLHIS